MIRSALTFISVMAVVLLFIRGTPAQELDAPAAVFQQQELGAVFDNTAEQLLADQFQPNSPPPAKATPFAAMDVSGDSFQMANLDTPSTTD